MRTPSAVPLFARSPDGWENSSLLPGFDDWRSYANCYRQAAEALVDRFPVPLDSPEAMFLPMLFLYRHYVETSLKGILAEAITVFSMSDTVPADHKLPPLWRQVRRQLEGRGPLLEHQWFKRAEDLVMELARVDPDSMHFRYPVSKGGGRLLEAGFTLSTRHLKEAMDDLVFVLQHLEGYMSAIHDFGEGSDTNVS